MDAQLPSKALVTEELEKLEAIYQLIAEFVVNYSFQLLGALLITVIGVLVANKCSSWLTAFLAKKDFDVTLAGFMAAGLKSLIIVVFLIIALGKLGISIGPFVAALGAISLGAGLALQGTLSNYGAGISLIIARPFVVGDTIRLAEVAGLVTVIKLAYTQLIDEDGVEYTIPNKHIVGEVIANSHSDSLLELTVTIGYQDDPARACQLIKEALAKLAISSAKREPLVGVDHFADSGISIGVRLWTATEQLFEARYSANLSIHQTLTEQGFHFPYPQREVRLLGD